MSDIAAVVPFRPDEPVPEITSEARLALTDLARGKTGKLPAEWLAARALAATAGGDFPVQRAALEALCRRLGFARRDELLVGARPPGDGRGFYRIAAKRASRPYRTLLRSVEPWRGSCDCPDFAKGALGLCKHLLVVAEDLARRDLLDGRASAVADGPPRLIWDPVRPLTGRGDWIERVRFEPVAAPAPRGLSRWFDGAGVLRPFSVRSAGQRLALCRELLSFLAAEPGWAMRSDPALGPLLRAEVEALERAAACAVSPAELRLALRGLKQSLYPYQADGLARFLASGRLLLADDMGLGKTAQAIAACHVLFGTGRVRRGSIVAPASLKPQWLREWAFFTDAPVTLVEGAPAERAKLYRSTRAGFLLVNYEQVVRDLPSLVRFDPELVVLDEAQRIKNWEAKTSACVKQLAPRFRLVLTGTPMENRLDELASLVEWIDEQALEPKWRLGPLHATTDDGRREVSGARHLDTLRVRLSGCLVRRLRKDVLAQLPPRTDTRVPVPLTPEQAEAHEDLVDPIRRLIAVAKRRPLTQVEFLRLMGLFTQQRVISNGLGQRDFEETWPALAAASPTEPLLRSLCSPKLLELRELLRNVAVEQGRKVVVFSQWRRMLRLAQWATSDVLAGGGVRATFFTGEEGQRRRTQNLVDFHDDPAVRVLFATDAGGVGLNLQRAANCCVNLELPWNPAVLEQRIGRIFRNGQKSAVDVYCLVSEVGIEDRIANLVEGKRAMFAGLFDGASNEIRFEGAGSFLSRVEKLVAPAQDSRPAATPEDGIEMGAADEELELIAESIDSLPAPERVSIGALPPAGARGGEEPRPTEVASLFSRVEVRPLPNGNIAFEAPPEIAASIAALFEGMSRMFAAGRDRAAIAPAG